MSHAEDDEEEAHARERGRLLFAQECQFLISAAGLETVPPADRPEVAFAGRSNVGKSSLVNALTGRKTLAKTSGTPGRTRLLNFFLLGEALYLVDLPGYGYARAPKTDIARWTKATRAYLRGRPNLRRVLLLVDSRHGLKPSDLEIADELDSAAVSYQAVLTKIDKISAADLQTVADATAEALHRRPAAHPTVRATSANAREGVAELRADLAALAVG